MDAIQTLIPLKWIKIRKGILPELDAELLMLYRKCHTTYRRAKRMGCPLLLEEFLEMRSIAASKPEEAHNILDIYSETSV